MKYKMIALLLLFSGCKDDLPCTDADKINPQAACPYVLMPVCGCDGKTYSNACVAENAGVTSWKSGACE